MRVCLLVWMHVWTRKVGCTCVGVWVSACVGTCVCGFLRVCRYLCVHTCAHVGTCACGYFYLHVRAFHMGHRASMASRICAPVLLLIGHSTDATATQADACAYCDLCQSGLSDPPQWSFAKRVEARECTGMATAAHSQSRPSHHPKPHAIDCAKQTRCSWKKL